jgi:hypothetical protein
MQAPCIGASGRTFQHSGRRPDRVKITRNPGKTLCERDPCGDGRSRRRLPRGCPMCRPVECNCADRLPNQLLCHLNPCEISPGTSGGRLPKMEEERAGDTVGGPAMYSIVQVGKKFVIRRIDSQASVAQDPPHGQATETFRRIHKYWTGSDWSPQSTDARKFDSLAEASAGRPPEGTDDPS